MFLPLLIAAAALAGFHSSPRLAPAASFVAGKPVTVMCADTLADWQAQGYTDREFGHALVGGSAIYLRTNGCKLLLGKTINYDGFGAALLVLTHEAIHARGETDEGVADCAAVHEMPRVAVKFFGVKAGKQLRAVMANAWNYRERELPPYRTVC